MFLRLSFIFFKSLLQKKKEKKEKMETFLQKLYSEVTDALPLKSDSTAPDPQQKEKLPRDLIGRKVFLQQATPDAL